MRNTNEARHNKSNASERQAKPKPNFRSRVTAGLTLLPGVDGRSTWARIMRDTFHSMLAHAGGADYVPDTKRLLARRIACLESELINLETRFASYHAEGRDVGTKYLGIYQQLSNTQRRCLEALGWERTARDVTPSLSTYLSNKSREADDAEEAEEAA